MAAELDIQKTAARKTAKQRRKAAVNDAPNAAMAAMDYLLEYLDSDQPQCIAGYLPIGSELSPVPLMDTMRAKGATIALPVVIAEGAALIFRRYAEGDALITEAFSTRAPAPECPEIVPNTILVPMLAFDRRGYRLGYGGGFYDRTIALFQKMYPDSRFLGFAYADQQVADIPIGAFDLPLDAIITERGIIQTRDCR